MPLASIGLSRAAWLGLVALGVAMPRIVAGDAGSQDLTTYPWVGASQTVRLPKALLARLEGPSTEIVPRSGVPWSRVSEDFLVVYRLTDAEATALTEALRAYERARRFEAGRHLKALPEGPGRQGLAGYRAPDGLEVLDQRTFELPPFADHLVPLREAHRGEVIRILGKERGEAFLARKALRLPPGARVIENTVLVTLRLIELAGRRSVDRVRVYVGGGGSEGGPFFEEEDEFLPEPARSVLRGWRAGILEFERAHAVPASAQGDSVPAPGAGCGIIQPRRSREDGPAWEEASGFVDLPKSALPRLRIAGMAGGELSAEAAVVFGLTSADKRAVGDLYQEFQGRFERLEASQLECVRLGDGGGGRFLLHRFPVLANELKEEWVARLAGLVGGDRAKGLDGCLREQPIVGAPGERGFGRGISWRPAGFGVLQGGSIWLNRGEKDVQFDVSVEGGAEGRFSLEAKVLEGKGSGSARLGGPMGGFPLDLRHLFPPGKLQPAGVRKTLGL